jgi:hypothetical protein
MSERVNAGLEVDHPNRVSIEVDSKILNSWGGG